MFDLIHEIAQTLRNNKLRTMLTGISVAWGIFMLIILLGAARGVTNGFESQTSESANNAITIWSGVTSEAYKGYEDGRPISLRDGDIGAIEGERSINVAQVAAYGSVDSAKIASTKDVVTGGFEAVYPSALQTSHVKMKHGRYINDLDMKNHRRVMVLSEKNARTLFGDDAKALGETVRSLGLGWTVVGVYSHGWRTQAVVPYSTYKALTGSSDDVNQIDVTIDGLKTKEDGARAEEALRSTLAKRHEFSPTDASAVFMWNKFETYLRNRAALDYLHIAVWIIGIFTLLTGIVGVSNIMFVSVRERTHEIGVRRAIGAKPRNILSQILAESVAITSLFGYIGLVLGMAILQLINMMIGPDTREFQNPTVDISIAIQVTVALIVAGSMAGLFPALKAIHVKPVEALRDE